MKVEYREDGGLAFAKVSWQKANVINQIKILYPSNQTPGVSSPIIQPLPEVISIPPSSGTRSTYTIQPGDTLTQVAQRYLGDANRWREITKDNGQSFTDDEARRLQAGQVIYFAGSGGSNNNSGNSGSTSSVGSYNRQAAVNYAQQYSNTKNPRYQYYTDANCANFVSQCLVQAGELPEKANSAGDQPFEYINADGFKNYLINQGLARAVGSINELVAGDVIAYSWDGGPIMDHVALYIGNGKVASNTTDGILSWQSGVGDPNWYLYGKLTLLHITAAVV
jgi:cell wall-associated NlpC family hydrolase